MKHNSIDGIVKSLVEARKGKGLSQTEMARRLDVPQSYISRLESGKLDMRLSSLIEIARYLNLEVVLVPDMMAPTVQALIGPQSANRATEPIYTLDDLDVEGG